MALVFKDRIKETTSTTGTGTFTLTGAVTNSRAFSDIGDANTCYYAAINPVDNEWEVGVGTYTLSGTTLARTTVLANHLGTSATVSFTSKPTIFCTLPADKVLNIAAIPFIIDGGGSVLTAGEKGHIIVPFDCIITQVTALADQSGTVTIDIWKDTYANFPPVNGDSITASAPVALSTAAKYQDSTLTGWTLVMSAGDILAYNVDASPTPASITRLLVSLDVDKT